MKVRKATWRTPATFIAFVSLAVPVYAGQLEPATPVASQPTPPILPPAQSALAAPPTPPANASRVTAGLVLGSGLVAIAAGTTVALAATNDWGSPNRLGLGIACAGVPLAMVGTMLWFNVPQTGTQVSIGPSTLRIAGRF